MNKRDRSDHDQDQKKFPFLSLIAFVLVLVLFFMFAGRSKAFDPEDEPITRVVNDHVYFWDSVNEEWYYIDEDTSEIVVLVENSTFIPTPPTQPDPVPDDSDPETEPLSEPVSESSSDSETDPVTEPVTEPETDPHFDDSDRLDLIISDLSAIKSILIFSLVGVAAGLLLYMCYRIIRNFM